VTPIVLSAIPVVLATVPVDPDADEARQWVVDELTGSDYQAAQPIWFDQLSAAVGDWFASLNIGSANGPPGLGALIVILLVVAVLVVAFLIFGLPRLNRRSTVTGSLFGENDDRDAAAMRRAAELAASQNDFALAVAEAFRAIARGLAERTVLTISPGTTAHDFSVRAAASFPAFDERLADAATAFDDVRYLGGTGTREQYEAVASLESALRATSPLLETIPA
jgi:hypothetical protein